jgi:hypothetical protein
MFSQDAPAKAGREMMAMYFVALVIVALILSGVPLKGKGK